MTDDQTQQQPPDENSEEEIEVSETESIETELETGQQEGNAAAEEWREQALRIKADFENFKRRNVEEMGRSVQVARLSVVMEFLPVIDNFDRAFKHVPENIEKDPWYGGVQAIQQQFKQILDGLGITRIETVGKPFDPNLHEAIAHEPSEEYDEGIVSEEFEAGYQMGDQVIRHARVKVSNGKKK